MEQLVQPRREILEAFLLNSRGGFEVLDALVQANLDMDGISEEELTRIVGQFSKQAA